ncbi:MAG: RluA family pseudouridine synthase [Clostridiales bacterium]|nr:RluA family pseudouridine synthase [Clostridiales bacterium]
MPRILEFTVTDDYNGKKVIHFLRGAEKLSSSLVATLRHTPGGIMLNGEPSRTIDRIKTGDILRVTVPEKHAPAEPSSLVLQVVYEDEDIIVVNKPGNLAMHPTHNHQGDTLSNALSGYLAAKGIFVPLRAVGRLDKGTSGLVVCALNSYCAARLTESVEKTYYAVATGSFTGEGTIDKPIFRPYPDKTVRAVSENGDRAVTHWRAIKSSDGMTLLEIHLETGRTHQIRVHFSFLGAPLAGDDMYGASRELIERPALHCGRVCFIHPVTKEKINLYAPLPEDMQKLVDTIE